MLSLPAHLSKRERAIWHSAAQRLHLNSESTVRASLHQQSGMCVHHQAAGKGVKGNAMRYMLK
jgi:hypothetical protein